MARMMSSLAHSGCARAEDGCHVGRDHAGCPGECRRGRRRIGGAKEEETTADRSGGGGRSGGER
eukprot:133288-Rhodomonas_salina.2